MASDIKISVANNTSDRDLYILIFQATGECLTNPVVWKVVPLPPQSRCAPIVYPAALQAYVTETQTVWNSAQRSTFKDCAIGQVWSFATDGDFSRLCLTDQQAVDGVVTIANNSNQRIDVGLARGDSPLVVLRGMARGEQADFQLSPKLYFLAANGLPDGDLPLSGQIPQNAYPLDLTGLRRAAVTVSTKCPTSGELAWSHTWEAE